jgi:heme oxygenase
MFSAELKKSTQHVHAELEKILVIHMRKIGSAADYIDLLELMFGFYYPLQQKLLPFLDNQHFSGRQRGRQAENILADTRYFNPGQNKRPLLCGALPQITSYPSSLGALYVLEGSTLGGRIITGMIARQLGMNTDNGFSFFNAYGEETTAMWDNFKLLLDSPWTDEEKEEITAAASGTFSAFKNWITYLQQINPIDRT